MLISRLDGMVSYALAVAELSIRTSQSISERGGSIIHVRTRHSSKMAQFRYHKRTFLAPASSRTTSYIVAEVESSNEGAYALGTNMLTIADCGRQIELEFFLGNALDRQQSLAKAHLLAEVINNFCQSLQEEAKLIEKTDNRPRRRGTIKR